jgi:hypothetical protein
MTKSDFFRMLIKIFGLYSGIITVFNIIPANSANLFYQFDATILLLIISSIFISLGIFFYLIFKTDAVIRFFKLDSGFDEERIEIGNLNNESILKLAILIIGGFLLLDNIPDVMYYTIAEFRNKINQYENTGLAVNYFNWIVCVINIVIGLLFITNYKRISVFLDQK